MTTQYDGKRFYDDYNRKAKITVHYTTVDNYYESRSFETIEGARAWAMHWVGQCPELGMVYAISSDGVGKIQCYGCTVRDLFPEDAEYVFTIHTLDSHDHFGPFGSYKAAFNWGYEHRHTFMIQVQRVDK
jgi:hypothetical protein